MDIINEILNDYINRKVYAEVRIQARLIIDTLKEKVLPCINNKFDKREAEQWFDIVKENLK